MSGDISIVITQEQISALAEQIKRSVTTAQLAGLTALKTMLELAPGASVLAGAAFGRAGGEMLLQAPRHKT
ncbi:hypothetical protein [Burkholderia ubonensis]|uniref:Uncharacterized protein n=1 Tax=Burkholderia ubonensis TaxID=101571 RepID=A0ABD4EAY4_9BURK|nr:hypothetical protein [Burkholderia ubonensis]KVN92153.1 hypothetical protein WJ68_34310 [Burkholderia ubonensis]KVZ69422.1 hypothetical protein WL19_19690 [Burkholderia ubonensis]KVZ85658.1 hypothetical protein WL24_10280 [Burkholderia ubonensis]